MNQTRQSAAGGHRWRWAAVLAMLAGCSCATDLAYVSSAQVEALDEPLQAAIQQELQKWCWARPPSQSYDRQRR